MRHLVKTAGLMGLALALGACSSMTTISSAQPHTRLFLKDRATVELPTRMKLRGTSFGNYEFKAVEEGHAPMYGILPLAFKGGHLALDILFFAPATMFNLRGAFPYYEVDVADGVIRYRDSRDAPWMEYHPKPEEIARARTHFGVSGDDGRLADGTATTGSQGDTDVSRTGIIPPDDPSRNTGGH